MTSKAVSAVLVSVGLIAGGGITFAHYAAADSATNTPVVTASTAPSMVSPQEESDAAEKVSEQSMTPTQIKAKEDAEVGKKGHGDKNEVGEKAEGKDQTEMNDAAEAQLTPAQKAAHDATEATQESGSKDGNEHEAGD